MSLYLAKKLDSGTNQNAVFLAKQLEQYAPESIDRLGIMGLSRYPEVAYGMYKQHIDGFAYASFVKKTTFVSNDAFQDVYLPILNIPFTTPTLVFSPASVLSVDQAHSLLPKLGEGASLKNVGKQQEFAVPNPLIGKIAEYIKASTSSYGSGPERVSPLGYKAFVKAVSLIEMFLACNTYPAFKDLDEEVPQGQAMQLYVAGEKRKKDDPKTTILTYWPGEEESSHVMGNASLLKKRKGMDGSAVPEAEMEVDSATSTSSPWEVVRIQDPAIHGSVLHAKPSGQPSSVNFGSPGACPALPGLVFPYFKGLIRPDYTTIMKNMVTHFGRLFGSSFEDVKKGLSEIRRGVNNLSSTESGMEIAHVMKGIDLALETQTRLFLVFENGYRGFVLLGAHFAVHDGTKWVEPVSAEDVQKELALLDSHRAATIRLANLLSSLKMVGGGPPTPLLASAFSSSQKVISELLSRDIPDDQVKAIDQCITSFIWARPYVQLTPDTFLRFLDTALSPTKPSVGDDRPIFLATCRAPLGDHMYQHLGTFGPDAPSLWNTAGSKISVIDRRRVGVAGEEQPEPPKEITILPKPVLTALKDWETVFTSGSVSFKANERARHYRAHVVQDPGVKGKIWKSLQTGLISRRSDDDGEAPKKKQRREVFVAGASDILGLF